MEALSKKEDNQIKEFASKVLGEFIKYTIK